MIEETFIENLVHWDFNHNFIWIYDKSTLQISNSMLSNISSLVSLINVLNSDSEIIDTLFNQF